MLFRTGTIPWLFHDRFDMMVDFCSWVLEADGLHAAPFDSHTGGDGTLQAAGLDAASWQAWTHEVISVLSRRKCAWHYSSAQKAKDAWTSLQGETKSNEERQSKDFHQTFLKSLRQINMDLLPALICLFPMTKGLRSR